MTQPQPLLFDARLIMEKPTGIGRYIASLLPEMVRLAPDLHFHVLLRPQPWAGYGLDKLRLPNLTWRTSRVAHMGLRQHWHVPRLAKALGAGLLHYPHFDAPVHWGRVPVVVTLHDARDLARPDFFIRASGLKRAYMRFFIGEVLKRARGVITVSHAMAKDLGERFGCSLDRVTVVHEAADAEFRPAAREAVEAFRRRRGLTRPYVLHVGERRPHKNQVGLIRAFALSKSRVSHDLVIIGKLYKEYQLPEQTAKDLGIGHRVHFFSDVDHEELVAAYTGADLFVLVSLYEGFGLPLLEAMACGTPVIGSTTTATGEVTGEGGLLVDPEDDTAIAASIDGVLGDAARRAELVARGARWVKRFTWERAARETLAVYRRILN